MNTNHQISQRVPSIVCLLAVTALLLSLAVFAVACGNDDGDTGNGGNSADANDDAGIASNDDGGADASGDDAAEGNDDDAPATDDDASVGGDSGSGTITVGDQTWNIVPSTQCAFFADGQVIYIAGHAVEDEAIEIFIDYDAQDDFYNAAIEEDGEAIWTAEEESLEFEVSGNSIRGSGSFMRGSSGDTAEGSFEVTC